MTITYQKSPVNLVFHQGARSIAHCESALQIRQENQGSVLAAVKMNDAYPIAAFCAIATGTPVNANDGWTFGYAGP
jgi:hypothetical protein